MSDLTADNDHSVYEAADKISSLLAPTASEATPDAPQAETPASDPPLNKAGRPYDPTTGKLLPTKPKEEETDDGEEVRPEADEAQEEVAPESEQDTEEEDASPAPTLVKVKVDGIEQQLPLDEVLKGYSRQADYTRKTQELAEERRRFDTEERTPLRQERQQYAERLGVIEEAVQALLPTQEPDWTALRNQLTPEEFTNAFTAYKENAQRLSVIKAERDRVSALQQQEEARARQAHLANEYEKLKSLIPEFADAEKGKQLRDDLVAYAKSPTYGFTDDDLAGVTDSRVLLLLDKARRYDEAQLRKPKVEAKIDRALETIKPSTTKSKPKMSEVERGMNRLKQSGRVDDAAELLNALGIR